MGNSMTKSELLAELYGRLPTFRERDCMDAAGGDHRYDEPDPR